MKNIFYFNIFAFFISSFAQTFILVGLVEGELISPGALRKDPMEEFRFSMPRMHS
ncbi:MAG: hypothetical protein ACUVUG_03290 [Candidatus Aminicenantia bacterium]